MGRIIGIDLGTTNTLAAFWRDGKSVLIPNALGEYLTPSVVSIDKDGTVLVGKTAKERLVSDPDRTICEFKRNMGTDRKYSIGDRTFSAEELSALVLKSIKADAEAYLHEPVEEAVISVPAYFGDKARKATRRAGLLAGLKVDRIVNEPSAAALAYRHTHQVEDGQLLVFDFGGGTLDVSLVDCFQNIVEILAVSGDNRLGGLDFDHVLARNFCITQDIEFESLDPSMKQILLKSAERAKRILTINESTEMVVNSGNLQFKMPVSRKDLIKMSPRLFDRMGKPIKTVLRDSKISPAALKGTVLVGGSCKMQVVQQYLKFLLKTDRIQTVNPDYMVALGVGIYAGIKEHKGEAQDLILTDICPFSLGTDTYNRSDSDNSYMSVIIPRNSPLPCSRESIYQTTFPNQTALVFGVYQGEDMYTKNNLKLAELRFDHIPSGPAGQEKVAIRYTYDINGLLFVDATLKSTGETRHLLLGADDNSEETMQQIEMLKKLRMDPRESQELKLLSERAARVYQQLTSMELRQQLMKQIQLFNDVMSSQDVLQITKQSALLQAALDTLEREELLTTEIDDTFTEDFLSWYDSEEDDEDPDAQGWSGY